MPKPVPDHTPITSRQEIFCRGVASGLTHADAYRQAYKIKKTTKMLYERASTLANSKKITKRINEIREPAIEKARVTLEAHINRLHLLGEEARGAGQFAPAIKAEHHRGQVCGLYIDKQKVEHSGPGGTPLNPPVGPVVILPAKEIHDE